MKIITAYKGGGRYTPEHIDRLGEQVKEHSGLDLLTIHGTYPHWWCKMNIFQIKGPVVYFDLDTIIIDDLSPLLEIAEKYHFTTAANFNHPEGVASGLMTWNGDMSHLYNEFAQSPERHMRQYPGGDQDFINDRESPPFIQDLIPDYIQSYKVNVRRKGLHPDCGVVYCHGNPRPWSTLRSGKTVDEEILGLKHGR